MEEKILTIPLGSVLIKGKLTIANFVLLAHMILRDVYCGDLYMSRERINVKFLNGQRFLISVKEVN